MLSLQEISDRMEIEDMLYRYAELLDTVTENGNADALLDDVFAPDAVVDSTELGFKKYTGEEFTNFFRTEFSPLIQSVQHLNGTKRITVDGDIATGRIMCSAPAVIKMPNGERKLLLVGVTYRDKYVRTDKGWRIKERYEQVSHQFSLAEDTSDFSAK